MTRVFNYFTAVGQSAAERTDERTNERTNKLNDERGCTLLGQFTFLANTRASPSAPPSVNRLSRSPAPPAPRLSVARQFSLFIWATLTCRSRRVNHRFHIVTPAASVPVAGLADRAARAATCYPDPGKLPFRAGET